jgi:hypothetical protein
MARSENSAVLNPVFFAQLVHAPAEATSSASARSHGAAFSPSRISRSI